MVTTEVDQLRVNALRVLAMDTVQKANSGHPRSADGSCRDSLRSLDSAFETQPA